MDGDASLKLTVGSSPPILPKFRLLPWFCRPDGGLPPLAGGWGMGDGEVAGEVIRGFDCAATAKESVDWTI